MRFLRVAGICKVPRFWLQWATSPFIFGHSLYLFYFWSLVAIPSNPGDDPFLHSFTFIFFLYAPPHTLGVSLLPYKNHRILALEGCPDLILLSVDWADYQYSKLMTTQGFKWCFPQPESCEDQFSASCFALIGICLWEQFLRIENYYSLGHNRSRERQTQTSTEFFEPLLL